MWKISRGRFLKAMGRCRRGRLDALHPGLPAQHDGAERRWRRGRWRSEEKELNLYNWSDYVAKSTIPDFEKRPAYR